MSSAKRTHKKGVKCGWTGFYNTRNETEFEEKVNCKNCLKVMSRLSPYEAFMRQRESNRKSHEKMRILKKRKSLGLK